MAEKLDTKIQEPQRLSEVRQISNLVTEPKVMRLGDLVSMERTDIPDLEESVLFQATLGLKEKWLALIKSLFWGSIITLSLMIFLAFWAIIGFERLFILFHVVSFSNKLWILDPSKDYLIMMFPGGFFYDMALLGFGAVILVSLIIGAASFGTMRISDAQKQHCA